MSVNRILFFWVMMGLFCAPIAAKGVIKFQATSLSFGEVKSGEVADLQFEFSNIGDSALIIQNVTPTCGCTVAQLAKKEYAPGEKGVIPIRFFSRGYSGRVTKTISVSSNDPDNPQIRLQLTGMVNLTDFADIEVSKQEIKFGKKAIGKMVSDSFTIKNKGNQELRLTKVTHSPDLYLIFPKSMLNPGEEIKVQAFYNPNRPGTFDTLIQLFSNAMGKGTVMIRVNIEVEAN